MTGKEPGISFLSLSWVLLAISPPPTASKADRHFLETRHMTSGNVVRDDISGTAPILAVLMHFRIKTSSRIHESKKRATRRKIIRRKEKKACGYSIFAGYLEELSVRKMNHYASRFPLDRYNLYLRAISLIINDLHLLVLRGVGSINGIPNLLGVVIQIGTESRILGGITFRKYARDLPNSFPYRQSSNSHTQSTLFVPSQVFLAHVKDKAKFDPSIFFGLIGITAFVGFG